jgi:hypothetical protein
VVLIRNFIELFSPSESTRARSGATSSSDGQVGHRNDISRTSGTSSGHFGHRGGHGRPCAHPFLCELTAGYLDSQWSDPGIYPLGSRQKLVARRMDRPLHSIIGRGFRGSCVTYPAMFLTPLLVVDAQTQAQVAPRTLAAPRLTQGGHQRRLWASVSGWDRCDRRRLGARAEKSRHSYVRRWFCGRLIPFFADACLHALVGPDTLPWAVWYTRNSFAGGGSRPLGRSRPPPPKADLCPRPARMLPVILPVICGVKSFNTEIKRATPNHRLEDMAADRALLADIQ